MTAIEIEVCVDNPQSLQAAIDADADRIELCSALELGGLTPSAALIGKAAKAAIPVYAMIRPRAGDFEFSRDEVELMIDDISACSGAGLSGIVIGASKGTELDEAAMEKMMLAAGGLGVTLHRVFDLMSDPLRAIDMAADLGIERILTSGGASSAQEGIDQIRRCVEYADGRLSIMAGGGINAGNAADIVRQTGVSEVHGSFGKAERAYAPAIRKFGFGTADTLAASDSASISVVRRTLTGLDG